MEIVRFSRTTYGIRSHFSRALIDAGRKTPGMHWDPNHRAWCGWPDAVRECARKLKKEGISVEGKRPPYDVLRTRNRFDRNDLDGLREYQKEGSLFLFSTARSGALLADDLGLGKTAQALRAIKLLKRDAIVVCPSFARSVWERECAKWLADWNVHEFEGVTPKPITHENCGADRCIYLIHYDIVYAWADLLASSSAKIIVFDEIHMLMSENSRRSQACRDIASRMKYRIGLSGTPMENRPADLWNPIDTLCPGRFGKPWDFYVAHANGRQESIQTREGPIAVWKKDGATRLKELNRRLRFFMLRRTRSDVRMELPPRTRQMVELQVKRNFRSLPTKSIKGNKKWLRKAFAIAADGKIPQAVDLIASHVANGSKVVVFSHRRIVAELVTAMLAKNKIDARAVTGALPRRKRTDLIDEQHDVLSCTMGSLRGSVDMSYADVVVFVELDYVPSTLIQCEGRVYRFGQKKNTLVQYLIAKDTADEITRDAVILKLSNFEKVIGKSDDELEEDLGSTKLSTAAQLRSLTEKMLRQQRRAA